MKALKVCAISLCCFYAEGSFSQDDVMNYSFDEFEPVDLWYGMDLEACDGELKISLYSDFKEPNFKKLEYLESEFGGKTEISKLPSGKWRVYLSGYDSRQELTENLYRLKESFLLKSLPFVSCYEKSGDSDEREKTLIKVKQIVFDGTLIGVFKVAFIEGKPILGDEVIAELNKVKNVNLSEYKSTAFETIPDLYVDIDDVEQSINIVSVSDTELSNISERKKTIHFGNFGSYSNYWLNYFNNKRNDKRSSGLTGSLNNYLSYENSTLISKVSVYNIKEDMDVTLDSLYLEKFSLDNPMIYSYGKMQGNSSKLLGVGIEYNRSLLNNANSMYVPPVHFTTNGPAYVELYQGSELLASMSTVGGDSKIESYQYVNTNDLTLVISENGLKKKYIHIPYDYSNISSLYKNGTYEWQAKIGVNEDTLDPIFEFQGTRGFEYYSANVNGYHTSSDRKIDFNLRHKLFDVDNNFLFGFSKRHGSYAGMSLSTKSGLNFYGKIYDSNAKYEINGSYYKNGLILRDDNFSISVSNSSSDFYINQFMLSYTVPGKYGSYSFNYTDNSDDDAYFGVNISLDFDKFSWFGDVNNRGFYSRVNYISESQKYGMLGSIRKDKYTSDSSGVMTGAEVWSKTEDFNTTIGFSNSHDFKGSNLRLSGGAIYSNDEFYLTSYQNPTIMILDSNSETLSAGNVKNDDGVLIVPLNSSFSNETVTVSEKSINKSLTNSVFNVTPKRYGIFHHKVEVDNIKYLVGYVERDDASDLKGTEVKYGNKSFYIGPSGFISEEIIVKNVQDEIMLDIPKLNCEINLPINSQSLIIDFGTFKCIN